MVSATKGNGLPVIFQILFPELPNRLGVLGGSLRQVTFQFSDSFADTVPQAYKQPLHISVVVRQLFRKRLKQFGVLPDFRQDVVQLGLNFMRQLFMDPLDPLRKFLPVLIRIELDLYQLLGEFFDSDIGLSRFVQKTLQILVHQALLLRI